MNSRYNSTFSNKSSKENIIIKLNQKLDDIYKREPHLFNDPNLFIKVYAALSRHKFKQPVRRRILQYFDNCLASPEIIENASKILNELGEDILLSHEMEE